MKDEEKVVLRLSGRDFADRTWRNKIDMLANANDAAAHRSLDESLAYQKTLLDAKFTIEVDSLDLRLYCGNVLDLVTFCYSYEFELDIKGNRAAFMDQLTNLLVERRSLSRTAAEKTAKELFPGQQDMFIVNWKNLNKPVSVR